jgi:hypothetical protein
MKTKYMLLTAACLRTAFIVAQIPNGSFENWTGVDPDSWQTSNTNNGTNMISVTKVSTAKSGANAMKLSTWSSQGFVFAPVAICPHNNAYFKYAGHPTMITGWYMANLQGGDQMVVSGVLRNGHSSIGGCFTTYTNSTNVYQQFQAPITYTGQLNSDSASMIVTIMGANGGGTNLNPASYIVVDDVQFSNGTLTGIEAQGGYLYLGIFHNPQLRSVRVQYQVTNAGQVNVSLYDVEGRLVKNVLTAIQEPGKYRVDEDLSGIGPGIYLLKVESQDGVAAGRVMRGMD